MNLKIETLIKISISAKSKIFKIQKKTIFLINILIYFLI
jgi:hypothetical protein